MNKVVLGVLIGLVALCLICGGVMCLGGRQLYQAGAQAQADAESYANTVMAKIGANWDAPVLKENASSDFLADTTDAELTAFTERLRSRLGSFKSAGPWKMSAFNMNTANGQSSTNVTLNGPAKFEKGDGDINLQLVKRGEAWKIYNLKINSPLLEGNAPETRADDSEAPAEGGSAEGV